jgi:hypothetical protein
LALKVPGRKRRQDPVIAKDDVLYPQTTFNVCYLWMDDDWIRLWHGFGISMRGLQLQLNSSENEIDGGDGFPTRLDTDIILRTAYHVKGAPISLPYSVSCPRN